jgi:hypothetical protein
VARLEYAARTIRSVDVRGASRKALATRCA